jgi:hypothetical protein
MQMESAFWSHFQGLVQLDTATKEGRLQPAEASALDAAA